MIFNLPTFFLFIGAQACAIVFSTVDRDSFEAVEKWRTKVKLACLLNYLCILHSAVHCSYLLHTHTQGNTNVLSSSCKSGLLGLHNFTRDIKFKFFKYRYDSI